MFASSYTAGVVICSRAVFAAARAGKTAVYSNPFPPGSRASDGYKWVWANRRMLLREFRYGR